MIGGRLAGAVLATSILALGAMTATASVAAAQMGVYQIPTGAMLPTLAIGAVVTVIPYFLGAEPERGDLIVFTADAAKLVKRVVGLPGDRVQMVGGELSLNGIIVARQRVDDFAEQTPSGPRWLRGGARRYRTASATRRSTRIRTAFSTTPTLRWCPPADTMCWATIATTRPTAGVSPRSGS